MLHFNDIHFAQQAFDLWLVECICANEEDNHFAKT